MPGPSNVHVWALELSCETPAASRAPALQTPPKFTRRHSERQKRAKMGAERKKKNAKFWAPTPRGPAIQGPTPQGPIFLGLGPPFGPHHDTHTPRSKWICQKWICQKWIGQNWIGHIGQIRMAKTGLAKVGPFRQDCPFLIRVKPLQEADVL